MSKVDMVQSELQRQELLCTLLRLLRKLGCCTLGKENEIKRDNLSFPSLHLSIAVVVVVILHLKKICQLKNVFSKMHSELS